MTIDKGYEFEVETQVDGVWYNVFCELYDHGLEVVGDDYQEVVYDPEFHKYNIIDSEAGEDVEDFELFNKVKEAAQESLMNLYWFLKTT